MSELSQVPVSPSGPEPFYQTWIKAFTRPNEQNFAEISASPNAKASKAYLWVFLTGLVNLFIVFALQGVTMRRMLSAFPPEAQQYLGPQGTGGFGLLGVICGAPVAAAFGVLFFAIGAAIIQWIAKLFGGQGNYDKLAYTMAAIYAPMALVSALLTLLGAIPFIGGIFVLVSFLVGIYALVLNITAIKGVNQFGWGQAAGSFFIPFAAVFLVCCCLGVLLGLLSGPVIGDVFSGINQSLGTY